MRVVGLISGTSVDAIDVAVADIRLHADVVELTPLGTAEHPWPAELRERILAVLPPAGTDVGEVCALDTLIGQELGKAAMRFNAQLVASLGQTVHHWVEDGHAKGTLQLGQPAWIAEATGLHVVSDLRARDVAAGGHGAPLAAVLDALWLADRAAEDGRTRVALNLGGIANITVVQPGRKTIAYDTGPANCLLDVTAAKLGQKYDRDGALALSGRVGDHVLEELLAEPYYRRRPPKSTGRELFHAGYLDAYEANADLMATLVELTARTVADAVHQHDPAEVIASGGGVRNPALLHGVPAVPDGATGARAPRVLGRLSPGRDPLRLPPPAPPPSRLRITPAR